MTDAVLRIALTQDFGLAAMGEELVAVDIDADGDVDLIGSDRQPTFEIWRNDGTGTLASPESFPTPGWAQNLEVTDLDGDGHLDVLARSGVVGVYGHFADEAFGFVGVQLPGNPDLDGDIAAADIELDGRIDYVQRSAYPHSLSLYRNLGQGVFEETHLDSPWSYSDDILLEDVDGDELPDIVFTSRGLGHVGVMRNFGGGRFGRGSYRRLGHAIGRPSLTDLDGDGTLDVVIPIGAPSSFTWLLNRAE